MSGQRRQNLADSLLFAQFNRDVIEVGCFDLILTLTRLRFKNILPDEIKINQKPYFLEIFDISRPSTEPLIFENMLI